MANRRFILFTLFFSISYCSELSFVQRPYYENEKPLQEICFQFDFKNGTEEGDVVINLNTTLTGPELEHKGLFLLPIFTFSDELISINQTYSIKGKVKGLKEYKFSIPEGEYYSSIKLDYNYFVSFGYISNQLQQGGDSKFIEYSNNECKYYNEKSNKLFCNKLKITENNKILLSIEKDKKLKVEVSRNGCTNN